MLNCAHVNQVDLQNQLAKGIGESSIYLPWPTYFEMGACIYSAFPPK